MNLFIQACSPEHEMALELLNELSSELARRTGSDGTNHFKRDDVSQDKSIFLLATENGEPVGCGALRPLNREIAEVKRMYARYPGRGIGSALLAALEAYARSFGYARIWLETRQVNSATVAFYLKRGYVVRDNYGPYIGRAEAVCFEKELPAEELDCSVDAPDCANS